MKKLINSIMSFAFDENWNKQKKGFWKKFWLFKLKEVIVFFKWTLIICLGIFILFSVPAFFMTYDTVSYISSHKSIQLQTNIIHPTMKYTIDGAIFNNPDYQRNFVMAFESHSYGPKETFRKICIDAISSIIQIDSENRFSAYPLSISEIDNYFKKTKIAKWGKVDVVVINSDKISAIEIITNIIPRKTLRECNRHYPEDTDAECMMHAVGRILLFYGGLGFVMLILAVWFNHNYTKLNEEKLND